MLEDGLSYPARGDWIGRILIGGVLGFFSFLVVPVFFLLGYFVRVLETSIEGADEPPAFDEWGELFVTGLVAFVITFAYSIVPVVVYSVVVFGLIGAGGAIGGDGGGLLAGLGFLSMLAFLPLLLLIYYVVPAALANYARRGTLGAGFDVDAIKPVVLSVDYLIAVLLPLVVAFVVWIVVGILFATIVGALLVPFVQFYAQVAIFRMFGLAFAEVQGSESTGTGPAAPSV